MCISECCYLLNFTIQIFSRRKIVTRGHRIIVVAGAPNRLLQYVATVEMKVLNVFPHHKFVPNGAHDIALLRLAGSFPDDNDFIKIIPLSDHIIPNGTICTIIGWGQLFYVCRLFIYIIVRL